MKTNHVLLALHRHSSEAALNFRLSKPLFRYTVGVVVAGFILSFIGPLFDVLVLTPNNLFNFHLWRLLTCNFIEPNPLLCAWSLYCAQQFITYNIELTWGLVESLRYFAIVQLAATLLIAWFAFLLFAFFQLLNVFYVVPVCGLTASGVAVLMALKQSTPDAALLTTPYGRLKNSHLPLAAVAAFFLLWLFGVVRGTVPLQALFGFQVSWTYLRYFQPRHDSDAEGGEQQQRQQQGDRSEHFTWASLFPRRVQPLATLFGRGTFRSLVALRVCKRLTPRLLEEMEEMESVEATVLPMESREAERRRQKALRVLNERLLTSVATGGGGAKSDTTSTTRAQTPLQPPSSITASTSMPSIAATAAAIATAHETPSGTG